MTDYDETLAIYGPDGAHIDTGMHSGHQANCRDGRHAPGCLHAPDCPNDGPYGPRCECDLPGLKPPEER